MNQPSTISIERLTPKIRKITFANPPANLIVPETVSRLHEVIKEMSEDPQVQVAIFTSSLPGFFFNHYDGTQALPLPLPGADSRPIWVDCSHVNIRVRSYLSRLSVGSISTITLPNPPSSAAEMSRRVSTISSGLLAIGTTLAETRRPGMTGRFPSS